MLSTLFNFAVCCLSEGQTDMHLGLKRGDPVIYRVFKTSTDPGPRAQEVYPAEHGDWYSYQVDKYWAVSEVLADGSLKLVTRRGKQHTVPADDPRLRVARWWERWFYRDRFPAPPALSGMSASRSA
jgi:hypothetical protein